MEKIELIKKKILKFRDERDWKQFHNPKDLSLSLLLESAELLEHFQWKNGEQINEHLINKKGEISEELADILYYVLLISNDLDIDILKELEKKIEKNKAKYPVDKSKGNSKKYTEL